MSEPHEDAKKTNKFLGGLNNPWRLTIDLNEVPTEFDIDTGVEVSVISDSSHEKVGSPLLSAPDRKLKGPSNRSLPVAGQFTGVLKREVQQEIYVVKNLYCNLL